MRFSSHYFDVWENVYDPAEDSFLFAENLHVDRGAQVLDVGTGCGILGILATESAKNVVAVDVNPYAIGCAKENSELNKVRDKVDFIRADLLTSFNKKARFDLILFNAPYVPSAEQEAETWMGKSWAGGINGRQVIDRFISQAPTHLNQRGRILLLQSTLASVEDTIRKFETYHLEATIKAECKMPFFETLILIEARKVLPSR